MSVQMLLLPIIDGDVCYYGLNADLLNKYDRLLNNCIRFVFNLSKYDHVISLPLKLNWLPFHQRPHIRANNFLHYTRLS